MTTAMQIGETARDRADFCRCFKTGTAVFLHDDGIVAHSTYSNTLRAAYMLARTNCHTAAASLSEFSGQKRRFGPLPITSGLPDKRTFSESVGMSQRCHKRTSSAQSVELRQTALV